MAEQSIAAQLRFLADILSRGEPVTWGLGRETMREAADELDRLTKERDAAVSAVTDARMGVGMLLNAHRDERPTPYPNRKTLLKRLRELYDILSRVSPASPLRESANG